MNSLARIDYSLEELKMANIIVNRLEATKEYLDRLNGSMQNIMPFPNNKWDYEWCVLNYGAKWDIYNYSIRLGNVLYFLTANSDIVPFLEGTAFEDDIVSYEAIDIDDGESSSAISSQIIAQLLRGN